MDIVQVFIRPNFLYIKKHFLLETHCFVSSVFSGKASIKNKMVRKTKTISRAAPSPRLTWWNMTGVK